MAISKLEAGEYFGYTFGGSKPTLYFENGHYTQAHYYADNVGWHSSGINHHFGNIGRVGQTILEQIYQMRDRKVRIEEMDEFVRKFKNGKYKSDSPDAVLFECFEKGGYPYTHLSRSRLISKDEIGHHRRIDDAYITKVLENGNWAANEYHT